MITKPMLAVACEDVNALKFPVLATPKLDGIRCLIVDGKALTRNFKPVPNNYIREQLEKHCPNGFDGELMIKGADFNAAQSQIMSRDGQPDFEYHVFDHVFASGIGIKDRYDDRVARMRLLENLPAFVKLVLPTLIESPNALTTYEMGMLELGYEGVMVRTPSSPYKCGRSTLKEGYLLKIKRFQDDEAVVVGFEELLTNENEQTRDELGRAKRSTHKDGLVRAGTLGTLLVRDLKTGIEFGIGSGFTAAQRQEIWNNRTKYAVGIVTYKHQPSGQKDKPRFPVFKGFRNAADMSE